MGNASLLRAALAGNAMFSTVSGVLMLGWPGLVSGWLGLDASVILPWLGVGLILFAADLIHQATRRRMATWRAVLASVADMGWVLGTAGLLAVIGGWFSATGAALLVGVAAVVMSFGLLQYLGVARYHRVASGRYRHCVMIETPVSAKAMWSMIARLGDIATYAPSLAESQLLDDAEPGVGAVRQCADHGGRRWRERCVTYEPGERVEMEFLTDEPGFPFPVKSLSGGWSLVPGERGARVMVWWELTPRSAWAAPLLMGWFGFSADRDFPKVVRRMAEATGELEPEMQRRPRGLARLLPMAC